MWPNVRWNTTAFVHRDRQKKKNQQNEKFHWAALIQDLFKVVLYQAKMTVTVSSEISYKSLLKKKHFTEYEQKSLHSSPQTAYEK